MHAVSGSGLPWLQLHTSRVSALSLCPFDCLSSRPWSIVELPICPGTKHITALGPNYTQAHVPVLAVPPVQPAHTTRMPCVPSESCVGFKHSP